MLRSHLYTAGVSSKAELERIPRAQHTEDRIDLQLSKMPVPIFTDLTVSTAFPLGPP